MFRPQRYDGESHDDANGDFKESVQSDGPSRSRARDENDNRKRNARVALSCFSFESKTFNVLFQLSTDENCRN